MHLLNFSTNNSAGLTCIKAPQTGLTIAVALELQMDLGN